MHLLDRLVKFLEKWGIIIILFIVTLILLFSLYFQRDLTLNIFEFFLNEKEGAFLTIAGIFIGIYFAIFSFFIGIKPDSVMADLDDEDILTLVRFLRQSFVGSFVYIFLTLLNLPFLTGVFKIFYYFILIDTLLYMLLSALKVGIYMYITFKRDVVNLKDNIENVREDSYKIRRMLNLFEDYLENEKRKERELRNETIRNESNE
ncbi:hypothetical protein [Bacillus pumilus]|uniref:Uncharacterized protein n=1 Tax=Bacillus pumilus TaxID=1408 RepID=A0AAD2JD00_BACPU|nr:hypothetical protein [Bacillus pumilus]AVM25766.1 hypothetical protein C5695_18690 [Bacillus pumilus]TYS41790.1 hypothetical protein FZC68_12930 [Bacillus pumilus]